MKLQYPFMQLPLSFDAAALEAEVGAIESSAWRPHPQGYPGNDALTLVTTGFGRLTEGRKVMASSVEDGGQITSAARPRPVGTRSPRALEKGQTDSDRVSAAGRQSMSCLGGDAAAQTCDQEHRSPHREWRAPLRCAGPCKREPAFGDFAHALADHGVHPDVVQTELVGPTSRKC